MKFFKPEDFPKLEMGGIYAVQCNAADIANAKLEREWKSVVKCDHAKDKISVKVTEFFHKGSPDRIIVHNDYMCACGAKVEPASYKEVDGSR